MRHAYDIEVLRNFFSVTLVHLDTDETHQFVVCPYRDDRQALLDFISQSLYLVGYNSFHYDDLVMKMFVKNINSKKLNDGLYKTSQLIIEGYDEQKLKDIRKLPLPWDKSLDLYRLLTVDANKGLGLKQVAINLQYPKIQDMPIHHESLITANQVDMILSYNLNDVLITKQLYWKLEKPIQLRNDISELYGVDVRNASDSKMANILLGKIFEDHGYIVSQLYDLRTKRSSVDLRDCIPSYIQFETPAMQSFLERLKDTTVYEQDRFKFADVIQIGNMTYDIGVGGLHSRDAAGKFFATEDMAIRDADVASYYPYIIINNRLAPAHLNQDDFIEILTMITEERIKAKKNKESVKADALKITINSIFGKTASEYFWLEDRQVFLSVTLTGQLSLFMLIEKLHLAGIQNISANTDGIVCLVHKDQEETYRSICQWWQDLTKFQLEFTDYARYIRRDVNNYITVKTNGDIKEKGIFVRSIDVVKGYSAPVIRQCLYEYFINGIPVETTLYANKHILDFCFSQKAGGQFTMMIQSLEGKEELQKNNRYYVATKGSALYKQSKETVSKRSGLMVGNYVQILNDYNADIPFNDYPVNYAFYLAEIDKIIDEIEPRHIQNGLL